MLNSKQMKNLKTKYPKTMVIMMLFASALFFQFTVGCNQGPPEGSRAKQAMRGADIFKVQCAPCHGMGEIAPTVDTLSINAVEMANALIAANKQFDTYFYPNRNHGIFGGVTRLHLYQKMTDFIKEKL